MSVTVLSGRPTTRTTSDHRQRSVIRTPHLPKTRAEKSWRPWTSGVWVPLKSSRCPLLISSSAVSLRLHRNAGCWLGCERVPLRLVMVMVTEPRSGSAGTIVLADAAGWRQERKTLLR
ncbi:hypothetical protein CGLO_16654 [Colletotrichum gloeosporioides Cg-14]|uniref:Uncharacterized protein n=1 Tax=Colletotrichum gloeosporioides (strain Cg-14) TaxID=1237896 RepID=T0JVL2_COLGC|nr:hypothetical protein CGLO_16654 [Colletotrichum gloeosporioides Cg-14]